jgi:hypothetical protein
MDIRYTTELPRQVPSSLPVYRLAPPKYTMNQLAAMSQQFGLSGKRRDFILSEDWMSYLEGRFRLSIHRLSGALHYANDDKYGQETENEFRLSLQDTEKISGEFLERIRIYPSKNLRLHKITHLRRGTSDIEGKERTEKLLDAGVIYRRLVDETPVDGPGGYAMVNIDPEGAVVGLRSVWRQTLRREAKVKIIPVSQAVETFEKSVSKVEGDLRVITSTFGYFEQGEMDRQLYLEPAYVFIYSVQNGEVAHKSIEVIAAGDKKFAKLMGKKRFSTGEKETRESPKANQEKESK